MRVWRLTSVCLSVAYIGPKSRTERTRKNKIGTEVAHVTFDSDTTFKVKRPQGRGILWRPPAQLVNIILLILVGWAFGRISVFIKYPTPAIFSEETYEEYCLTWSQMENRSIEQKLTERYDVIRKSNLSHGDQITDLIVGTNVTSTDRIHDTEVQDSGRISCFYWRFADGRFTSDVWSSFERRYYVSSSFLWTMFVLTILSSFYCK